MSRHSVVDLAPLPWGQHYTRITFPRSWCRHDHEGPMDVARGFARAAGLTVAATAVEGRTIAVYAIEPNMSDARGWDRYRALKCSSAQRWAR